MEKASGEVKSPFSLPHPDPSQGMLVYVVTGALPSWLQWG